MSVATGLPRRLWLWIPILLWATTASAKEPVHSLRPGETVEMVARHYYGQNWKAVYILARNQLDQASEAKAGRRLAIPSSWIYKVRKGDTLSRLARKYLGDAERFRGLAQANGLKENQELSVGQELVMPFHLRYTVKKGDSLSAISRRFYRTTNKIGLIRDYNPGKSNLNPGDVLTIPIFDRGTLEAPGKGPMPPGMAPKRSAESAPFDPAALNEAIARYHEGEFTDAQARLESILDTDPPKSVLPELLQYLAFCAVAHDAPGDAEEYFQRWLELKPNATLDSATSPKILEVYQRAKAASAR